MPICHRLRCCSMLVFGGASVGLLLLVLVLSSSGGDATDCAPFSTKQQAQQLSTSWQLPPCITVFMLCLIRDNACCTTPRQRSSAARHPALRPASPTHTEALPAASCRQPACPPGPSHPAQQVPAHTHTELPPAYMAPGVTLFFGSPSLFSGRHSCLPRFLSFAIAPPL